MQILKSLAHGEVGLNQEEIYGLVLDILTESSNQGDWFCLCQLSYLFAEKVPRTYLREAMVKIWHEADGAMKDDIAYWLGRTGFFQRGSGWS